MSQFHKAERKRGKLRLAIAGPAGSGKTYSALLIAFGIGGRVAFIDTERGSGELYDHLGEYDACTLEAPFEPKKYVAAIKAAEEAGYDTIIIDSLTHAWAGTGGLLDRHGMIADKSGNSWAAWRMVTPQHNELVDALLQSTCHIIATMRSKMEYTQVEEGGKKSVKKLGMSPIQRDGMEYEFTVFMDIDQNHIASSTKDRTTLFDGQYFKPSKQTGRLLVDWLEKAPEAQAAQPQGNVPAAPQNKPAVMPESAKAKKPVTKGGNGSTNSPQGGGNGFVTGQVLFDKLNKYGIPTKQYMDYACKRYSVESFTDLIEEQIKEQDKLLDSMARPERLKEFKELLTGHKFAQSVPPVPVIPGNTQQAEAFSMF
jgi:hypothetical protein